MDINMPEMDGLTASDLIKKEKSDIYIIILTGYDYFEYAQIAIRARVDDYILKPISKKDIEFVLKTTVDKLIQKKKIQTLDKLENIPQEMNTGEEDISKMNFGDNGYGFIATSQEKLLFDSNQKNSNNLTENKKYIELIKSRMKSLDGDFIGETIDIPNTDWNLIKNIKHTDDKLSPIPLDKHSSNEIQDLTVEFNQLLLRVSDLNLSIAEKEEAKRIFELKALQSQINPHFIYNTLDTIMWLIEFNENEKAIEVTKSLGKILRLTLGINQDFVRLEEEVAHVKNYLEIQKIRYDDKFEYKFDISKDTEQLKVPKLILQLIVENSIYHGIKQLKGKGKITIKSYIENETLFIIVEDNGIGPKSTKDKNIKIKLSGIGMSNVDQRIKILNNDSCGIELSRKNGVTRVVYRLEIRE